MPKSHSKTHHTLLICLRAVESVENHLEDAHHSDWIVRSASIHTAFKCCINSKKKYHITLQQLNQFNLAEINFKMEILYILKVFKS